MQRAVPLPSSADPHLIAPHTTHTVYGGVAHTSGPIARLGGGGALTTTLRAGAAAHRHLCTLVRSALARSWPRFWHTTSNRTRGISRPIDCKDRSALLYGSYPSALPLPSTPRLVWAVGGKPNTRLQVRLLAAHGVCRQSLSAPRGLLSAAYSRACWSIPTGGIPGSKRGCLESRDAA